MLERSNALWAYPPLAFAKRCKSEIPIRRLLHTFAALHLLRDGVRQCNCEQALLGRALFGITKMLSSNSLGSRGVLNVGRRNQYHIFVRRKSSPPPAEPTVPSFCTDISSIFNGCHTVNGVGILR